MIRSTRQEVLPYPVEKVWDIVVSLEGYAWRSDITNIEVIDDNTFVEYTKQGFPTTFVIVDKTPYTRYAFSIDNANMQGMWEGLFSFENGQTTITFTEEVEVKKKWMKPLAKGFLKKQQKQYMEDLKKAL